MRAGDKVRVARPGKMSGVYVGAMGTIVHMPTRPGGAAVVRMRRGELELAFWLDELEPA